MDKEGISHAEAEIPPKMCSYLKWFAEGAGHHDTPFNLSYRTAIYCHKEDKMSKQDMRGHQKVSLATISLHPSLLEWT